MPYDNSRGWFRGEEDFPGPRTMAAAANWIDDNAGRHKRFMLFIDEFDPHEPFDTPEPYASMYDATWRGAHLIWPPYMKGAIAKGVIDERQATQIRAQYGGKLTMIDAWFGRVLQAVDRNSLAGSTAIIVCSDHGHYLGEKDIWGKPAVPIYDALGRLPLLVAWPGVTPRTIDALTTSVDLFATIADMFGAGVRQRTHGKSLVPLIEGRADRVRDWLLMGVWGREVHISDGRFKYARAPAANNAPLSMWSNRWSTMPTHVLSREQELPLPDDRAVLSRMPGSAVPVIRQPWDESDALPFWAWTKFSGNHLFDTENDPAENEERAGGADEKRMAEMLRHALEQVEAPDEQFTRLGLR
jgi:arylsulfatase A-like enzyme